MMIDWSEEEITAVSNQEKLYEVIVISSSSSRRSSHRVTHKIKQIPLSGRENKKSLKWPKNDLEDFQIGNEGNKNPRNRMREMYTTQICSEEIERENGVRQQPIGRWKVFFFSLRFRDFFFFFLEEGRGRIDLDRWILFVRDFRLWFDRYVLVYKTVPFSIYSLFMGLIGLIFSLLQFTELRMDHIAVGNQIKWKVRFFIKIQEKHKRIHTFSMWTSLFYYKEDDHKFDFIILLKTWFTVASICRNLVDFWSITLKQSLSLQSQLCQWAKLSASPYHNEPLVFHSYGKPEKQIYWFCKLFVFLFSFKTLIYRERGITE